MPPEVLMRSFLRSVIRRNPSASISAMSPVRSQPSSSDSLVASGLWLYSRITPGPLTSNSPSGASLTSIPGIGLPTVP